MEKQAGQTGEDLRVSSPVGVQPPSAQPTSGSWWWFSIQYQLKAPNPRLRSPLD